MKTTLIKNIIALSIQSRYGNVMDTALYRHTGIAPQVAAPALNTLYKEGMITVQKTKGLTLIRPTALAIKTYPNARPVSREVCMTVFKTILDIADNNKPHFNASYVDVSKACAHKVGHVTLDNAISKLLQAGYIRASKPTANMTVYVATKKGVENYTKALSNPVQLEKKTHTKRTLSEEQQQQQAVLKELSKYVYIMKAHDKKLRMYPNYVFSDEQLVAYTNACAEARKLQLQLNLA